MVVQEPIPVGFLDGSLQQDAETEAEEELASCPKTTFASAAAQASSQGDIETLKTLAGQGWKPQQIDRSTGSALHWAAGAGHIRVCEYLLDTWPSLNIDQTNKSGRTALHWAARNGQKGCCEWLRQRNADITARTLDGITLFHWAVWSGSLETAKWALDVGTDPHALNRWGCGAIHWASAAGSVEMCTWLRSAGLDFTLRNNQGHDGLGKAAWNGCEALVKWFLTDPVMLPCLHHTDRAGLSPADLAQLNGHPALAQLLSEAATKESGGAAKPAQSGMVNQGFVVYYSTQGILSSGDWLNRDESLLRRPSLLLHVTSAPSARTSGLSGHWIAVGPDKFLQYPSTFWRDGTEEEKEHVRSMVTLGEAFWLDPSCLPTLLALDLQPQQLVLATGDGARISDSMALLCPKVAGGGVLQAFRVDRTDLASALKHAGDLAPAELQTSIVAGSFRGMLVPFLFTNTDTPAVAPAGASSASSTSASTASSASSSGAASATPPPALPLCYDRVWVQSSCSNDGTFRLHPERLREWKMSDALTCHSIQIKELVRSLQMVCPRGRLVYSTLSLDPLQNEAVVMAALKKFKGLFELVEVPQLFGMSLRSSRGLMRWLVPDNTAFKGESLFRFHQRWSDVPNHQRKPQGSLVASLFCPEEDDSLAPQLARCVRIAPSSVEDSSTGNALDFPCYAFIAVFSRVLDREWPNTPSNDAPPSNLLPRFARRYVSVDSLPESERLAQIWPEIVLHYGLGQISSPTTRLFLECDAREGRVRAVCLLSLRAEELLQSQQLCHARAGLRLFRPLKDGFLKGVAFRWQVCVEAAEFLRPRMSRGVHRSTSLGFLTALLQRRMISAEELQALDKKLFRRLSICDAGPFLLKACPSWTRLERALSPAVGSGPKAHSIARALVSNSRRLDITVTRASLARTVRLLLPGLLLHPPPSPPSRQNSGGCFHWLSCVWTGDGLALLTTPASAAILLARWRQLE